MLHAFFMNSGTLWSFEDKYAAEPVSALCAEIERKYQISVNRQILIASGGERMLLERRVSSYNVGVTESNPIFVFDSQMEGVPNYVDEADDADSINREFDLDARVKDNLNLPAAFETVQKRMQLTRELDLWAQTEVGKCDVLVREQYMLHQGWSAAVAHVDEFATSLKASYARYSELCVELLSPEKRDQFAAMLSRFNERTELLKRIPLTSFLRERYGISTGAGDATLLELVSGEADQEQASLGELEQRARTMLEAVARDGSEQADDSARIYTSMLRQLSLGELREIRGVSRRLREVQAVLEDVRAQAVVVRTGCQSLAADLDRLRAAPPSVRDRAEAQRGGVLAEMCTSHRSVLPNMRDAATRAANKRRMCARAKYELRDKIGTAFASLATLHARAAAFQRQLVLRAENLARLSTLRSIIAQLDAAPRLYVAALSEMRRRRMAAATYRRIWQEMHARLRALYEPDCRIRSRFVGNLRAHFLKHVFNDFQLEHMLPVPTTAPSDMDAALPAFDDEDFALVESLEKLVSQATSDASTDAESTALRLEDAADLAAWSTACASSDECKTDNTTTPARPNTAQQRHNMSTQTQTQEDMKRVDMDTLQRQLDALNTQIDGLQARLRTATAPADETTADQLRSLASTLQRLADQCTVCGGGVEETQREQVHDSAGEREQDIEGERDQLPEAEVATTPALNYSTTAAEVAAGTEQERSVFELRDEEDVHASGREAALETLLSAAATSEAPKKEEQYLVDCLLAIRNFIFSATVPVAHHVTSLLVGVITELAARRLLNHEPAPASLELASMELSKLVSLSRCVSGELVLVYLSEQHASYMLFNLMPVLHFVHANSLAALNLPPVPAGIGRTETEASSSSGASGSPEHNFVGTRSWTLGIVTKKEMCVVRKTRNRFGLPLGSKFYHVRLQPLTLAGVKQVLAHAGSSVHETNPRSDSTAPEEHDGDCDGNTGTTAAAKTAT